MKDDNFATIQKMRKVDGLRLAIVGSRKIDTTQAEEIIRAQWKVIGKHFKKQLSWPPVAIIAGDEKGVGRAAQNLAHELSGCSAFRFLPDWITYGKDHASYMRANLLVQEADALLLIWSGKGKDLREVRRLFRVRLKPVLEIEFS